MTPDQVVILVVLLATVVMFLWGRWRHDMVAATSLLACVAAGLVPSADAFAGFGHPAVVTVAAVLVLSRGLQLTGAVDVLARRLLPAQAGPTLSIAALTALAAVLSAFMNNVGALALLMPVALQIAARQQRPAGQVLMPLAFGSILGGMTTLIGTPPNLIVSGFRASHGGASFGMFDFTPVGAAVAAAGVAFVALVGWRLVPARAPAGVEGFDTGLYLTEVRVTEKSGAAGHSLRELGPAFDEADAQVVGLVRHGFRVSTPEPGRVLRPGDIMVVEAEPESLSSLLSNLGLQLEEDVREARDEGADREPGPSGDAAPDEDESPKSRKGAAEGSPAADEATLLELAVLPSAGLVGLSATDIRLRTRYGINLLAISRQGRRSIKRLRSTDIQAGDVLLMQGSPEALALFATEFGCVPLAERAIRIPDRRRAATASIVMAAAIAGAAFGLLPAAVSFVAAVVAFLAWRVVPLRTVYEAIDWPVVVLLGALIPVAGAMASTGTADLLARVLLDGVAQGQPIVALTLVLVVTMTLSDFMNNAATAAVLCPIALSAAERLDANPDAFLMAVAIGASCAFLTPIGHQNNTLILGPGGLHFGDYWRLGLPLELLVVAISVPVLLVVWPL